MIDCKSADVLLAAAMRTLKARDSISPPAIDAALADLQVAQQGLRSAELRHPVVRLPLMICGPSKVGVGAVGLAHEDLAQEAETAEVAPTNLVELMIVQFTYVLVHEMIPFIQSLRNEHARDRDAAP
jgi:hypothetical protein